jgi:signal transduction histidine kinase
VVYSSEGDLENVMVDSRLLGHVLGNLISNAVKYSPDGGTVKLDVRRDGDEVVFDVEDNGIGISREDQKRIFESFHRGENVGTLTGTGLGLAIVKKSLEVHGGSISVESQFGRGTRFVVHVPVGGQV